MLTLLMLILEGLEEADKNNDTETEKSQYREGRYVYERRYD